MPSELEETSDEEFSVERGRGRGRAGRVRTRGGRGGRGRGDARGRGRGRGQGCHPQARLPNRAELTRANIERRKEEVKDLISKMSELEVRDLLEKTLERDPAILLDFMAAQPQGNPPPGSDPNPQSPAWCTCFKCREMPTQEERLCCGNPPGACTTLLADFNTLMLDEAVLHLAVLYRQDVLAEPAELDFNRRNRHAAYRQFVLWAHGRLGAGNRRVIPSCCVWAIRDKYPDPSGQYVGFIDGRLG